MSDAKSILSEKEWGELEKANKYWLEREAATRSFRGSAAVYLGDEALLDDDMFSLEVRTHAGGQVLKRMLWMQMLEKEAQVLHVVYDTDESIGSLAGVQIQVGTYSRFSGDAFNPPTIWEGTLLMGEQLAIDPTAGNFQDPSRVRRTGAICSHLNVFSTPVF